jgi:NADH-ubiquinone oxidoreductase chain 5
MYLLPLLSTLLSSVFSGFMVARGLGHRGIAVFSITNLFIAFATSALIWIEIVLGGCEVSIDLFGSWFEVGTFNVNWSLNFDLLTAHMLFTVTSVSLAVHLYAVVYMRSDPHLTLFMSYLSLFTFFMLVLVTGDSLIMMLVGWEGNIDCPNGFIYSFLLSTNVNKSMKQYYANNRNNAFTSKSGSKGIEDCDASEFMLFSMHLNV